MICATGGHTKNMAHRLHSCYSNNFIGKNKEQKKKGQRNKLDNKKKWFIQQNIKSTDPKTRYQSQSPHTGIHKEGLTVKLWNAECWAAWEPWELWGGWGGRCRVVLSSRGRGRAAPLGPPTQYSLAPIKRAQSWGGIDVDYKGGANCRRKGRSGLWEGKGNSVGSRFQFGS